MYKKILIFFSIFILMFCGIINVFSLDSYKYTDGEEGLTSITCTSGRCISTYGYKVNGYNFENTAIFGVRVTIVNSAGTAMKKPINFWATESMKKAVAGGIALYNYDNGKMSGTNVYESGVGLFKDGLKKLDQSNYSYSDYISGLSENNIISYLKHFYPNIVSTNVKTKNLTIQTISNYYIKFEPIYVMRFLCTGSETSDGRCDNDLYFIGGTTYQILDFGYNTPKFFPNSYFKYITRDSNIYSSWGGESTEHFNVIKNFALSTYITSSPSGSSIAAYGGSGCPSVDTLSVSSNENTHAVNQMILNGTCNARTGLGTGYVKISDKIREEDTCETELASKTTPLEKINLYIKYKDEVEDKQNNNNLLNFSSSSCTYTKYNLTSNEACLDVSKNMNDSNFSGGDLSHYNDTISYGGKTHYCLTEFDLSSDIWEQNKTVKSGMFVVKEDEDKPLATVTLTKTCYIHKDFITPSAESINNETTDKLSHYFGKIMVDKKALNSSINKNSVLNFEYKETSGDFYKYVSENIVNYSTGDIYATKGAGKIVYDNCSYCTLLGKGIISKFSDKKQTVNLNFYVEDGTNNVFDFEESGKNSCTYISDPEITQNNELYLEFRIIDTKEPFNRNTNSNWSYGKDNSKDNKYVKDYIINANNSYNKEKSDPIYKIILSPSDIKTIRKYNKDHKYDEYAMYCQALDNCVNAFVYDLKQGNLNSYKLNSSNISVVDKTYGNLSYKLTT